MKMVMLDFLQLLLLYQILVVVHHSVDLVVERMDIVDLML
jgi:hypothetical protein